MVRAKTESARAVRAGSGLVDRLAQPAVVATLPVDAAGRVRLDAVAASVAASGATLAATAWRRAAPTPSP